jgi:hypothetical protein
MIVPAGNISRWIRVLTRAFRVQPPTSSVELDLGCVRWAARWLAIAVVSVTIGSRADQTACAQAEVDEAVTAGAESLDSWWDYPWYDSQNDSIRRIDLKSKRAANSPNPTGGGGGTWSWDWLGWLLIALVVAAILFMLLRVYLNRDARRNAAGAAALAGAPASVDRLEELPFQLDRPADDLLTAARHAYEQGNFDQAIIFLYSHQLLELDKRQAIRLTKGKTNRQYLRELRTRPALVPLLATSMVAFEDVFFGGHSLGRERFEAAWQCAMQLLADPQVREAA